MELKFKNSKYYGTCAAIFGTCVFIFLFVFGLIVSTIIGQTDSNIEMTKIFGFIIVGIWILYSLCLLLFAKTVIVTKEQVIVQKGKKIVWKLNSEDIEECVYQSLTAGDFIMPSPNATAMIFKPKPNKSFSRKTRLGFVLSPTISLSLKNAKKMIEYGYNVRIIYSIHEQ